MDIDLINGLRRVLDRRVPNRLALERFAPSHARHQRFDQVPCDARPASVVVLLYRAGCEWRFPLVLRPQHLRHHQGQIALPGGACEPGETSQAAALRELHEELGISPTDVEVLGPLTSFFVPASRFVVHPWVGWTAQPPTFLPNPNEVDLLLEAPLCPVLDLSTLATDCSESAAQPVEVPYFAVGPHKVWGATCIVLGELALVCEGLTP